MESSNLLFVTAMFFCVAVAASAQSTVGGTYYGTTDILVNANEHLACPTTLQFDPNTNSATVTVNYRGTDMTSKIAGSFRQGVFHGRSEGRFFGLVYVQAMNYKLKFRSGTVKATSWSVNPTPGSDSKAETDVYRRTRPEAEGSDGRQEGSSTDSQDDSSDGSTRSRHHKAGAKHEERDTETQHLKDRAPQETKNSPEHTKALRLETTAFKGKVPSTTTSHKK